jgi:hypothetical protein
MRESLSAPILTPFAKWVFPLIMIGGLGYFAFASWLDPDAIPWEGGGSPPAFAPYIAFAMLAAALYVIARGCLPLRRVHVDHSGLYVGHWWTAKHVPWETVEALEINPSISFNETPVVRIRLRNGLLGGEIRFLPESEHFASMLSRNLPDVHRERLSPYLLPPKPSRRALQER